MIPRTLMIVGYASTVAAGGWALQSAYGVAAFAEQRVPLASCMLLIALGAAFFWVTIGGRITARSMVVVLLFGALTPFSSFALFAPHGLGFAAFAVMGAGVALTHFAHRRHRGPRAA